MILFIAEYTEKIICVNRNIRVWLIVKMHKNSTDFKAAESGETIIRKSKNNFYDKLPVCAVLTAHI